MSGESKHTEEPPTAEAVDDPGGYIPIAHAVPVPETSARRKTKKKRKGDKRASRMLNALDKIKSDVFDARAALVTIKYLDIKLELFFRARGRRNPVNVIEIHHLEREQYTREHPLQVGMQVRAIENPEDHVSEPGDGALFLALAVFHCNNVFEKFDDIEWRIHSSCWNNWWKRKSGIPVQHYVTQDDAGLDVYKIKSKIFLSWAHKKILDYQRAHQVGGKKKRRYKRTNKKRKKRKTRRKSKKRRRKRKKRKTKKRRR